MIMILTLIVLCQLVKYNILNLKTYNSTLVFGLAALFKVSVRVFVIECITGQPFIFMTQL